MSGRNPEAVADSAAEQVKTGPILAHDIYRNNAEVIAYGCVPLGILKTTDVIADITYGLGNFWSLWMPEHGLAGADSYKGKLLGSDIDPAKSPTWRVSVDGTATGYADNFFDAVVIDGPYKLNGTSGGGGPASSDAAYGVHVPSKWQDRHQLIMDMMAEGHRILKPGGVMLVKMQDQVCSQKLRMQTYIFAKHAIEELGMELTNRFQLEGFRAQPEGRRQATERSNYSTLHVYRKARR